MNGLDWGAALDHVAGAIAHLKAHARSNGKVGITGFCMGGAVTLSAASGLRGLSAAVPEIPAGWNYSHLFSVADGGPTAAVYAWGAAIQTYLGTSRLPSVTLSDIGYYTVRFARNGAKKIPTAYP